MRHGSDRTAILAFGSTPLVYVLASRNSSVFLVLLFLRPQDKPDRFFIFYSCSPISWITGARYSTLQVRRRSSSTLYLNIPGHSPLPFLISQIYHRWVARIVYLHVFLHSLGKFRSSDRKKRDASLIFPAKLCFVVSLFDAKLL